MSQVYLLSELLVASRQIHYHFFKAVREKYSKLEEPNKAHPEIKDPKTDDDPTMENLDWVKNPDEFWESHLKEWAINHQINTNSKEVGYTQAKGQIALQKKR